MNFKAWKEQRKAKKLERRDPYDKEEEKLQKLLSELKGGTTEYENVQKQLKANVALRSESRESKRSISKEAKGNLLFRLLGIGGCLITTGAIIYTEHKGMTFTGEKRKIMDSVSSCLGRIFFNR